MCVEMLRRWWERCCWTWSCTRSRVWSRDREGRGVLVATNNSKANEFVWDLRREKTLLDVWMFATDERRVLIIVGHGRNKQLDRGEFFGKR